MSIKSIQANELRFCTILDVIKLLPKIVETSINLDESDSPITQYGYQVDEAIRMASEEIYAALLSLYRSSSNLAVTPWVGAIISNRQNSAPAARLRACQAGASAITEHFTLTFSSDSAYTVTGWLSGGLGSGSITTDFTGSGDGDILIKALTNTGTFTGTFATGDLIFVSINKWHRFIARICADKAVAQVVRELAYSNGIGIDPAIYERYSNRAKRNLERLQNPDDKNGYTLSTLPVRDLSDINMGDWNESFDKYGSPDAEFFANDDIESYTS